MVQKILGTIILRSLFSSGTIAIVCWWWEAKEKNNIKREYVTSFVKTKYIWTINRER